jgi:homoserine kinase
LRVDRADEAVDRLERLVLRQLHVVDGLLERRRRELDDRYAEPRRAPMIPRFPEVKEAALAAGAFGCSISGSGPTIFAIIDGAAGGAVLEAMRRAMADVESESRIAPIARRGAHQV